MTDLIARLFAAGTDPALVAEVAMELGRLSGLVEASARPDQAAENRRAWDRKYRAEKREQERLAGVCPPDIHPTQVESDDIADLGPPLNKSPQTPKINPHPAHTHETRARPKFHRLPADWQPPEHLSPETQAKVGEWPPGMISSVTDDFRAWAANADDKPGKGRKADWDAAYASWLRREDKDWRGRNGQRNGSSKQIPAIRGGSASGLGSTVDAAQRWLARQEAAASH